MTLTTGATLQNGRYVIQDIVSQDEQGLTYRATHLGLEQPVVIQTLQELAESQDPDWLHQQFLSEVRRSFKKASLAPATILDCFVEAGIPFVVLSLPEGHPIPAIAHWLPPALQSTPVDSASSVGSASSEISSEIPPEIPPELELEEPAFELADNPLTLMPQDQFGGENEAMPLSETNASEESSAIAAAQGNASSLPEVVRKNGALNAISSTNGAATNGAVTNGAATNGASVSGAAMNGPAMNGASVNGATKNGVSVNGAATNGASAKADCGTTTTQKPQLSQDETTQTVLPKTIVAAPLRPLPQTRPVAKTSVLVGAKKRRWLPVALAFTSVFAGLGGASIGLMIRNQRLHPTNNQAPGILQPLINNEQSFPPIEGWPGDDPPEAAPPERSETTPYAAPAPRRDRYDGNYPDYPLEQPTFSNPPNRRRAAQPDIAPPEEFVPPADSSLPPADLPMEPAAEAPSAPVEAPEPPPVKIRPQPAAPAPEAPAAPAPEAPPPAASAPNDSAPMAQ